MAEEGYDTDEPEEEPEAEDPEELEGDPEVEEPEEEPEAEEPAEEPEEEPEAEEEPAEEPEPEEGHEPEPEAEEEPYAAEEEIPADDAPTAEPAENPAPGPQPSQFYYLKAYQNVKWLESYELDEKSLLPILPSDCKKGSTILLENLPCKVISNVMSKTAKHGHAKCNIVGLDIFTAKKTLFIGPAHAHGLFSVADTSVDLEVDSLSFFIFKIT